MERTRKVNGRTDGRTEGWKDGGHDATRPIFYVRIKTVDEVKVLNLCTSSDNALYFCKKCRWSYGTCSVHIV